MKKTCYNHRYDNHPEIIKLCMGCKRKDCGRVCREWSQLYWRLMKEEPEYNVGKYNTRDRG